MKVATKNPDIRKVNTATNERTLNRASPHKPWPLVQPFDSFVPNPTRMPARANPNWDVYIVIYDYGPNGVNLFELPYCKKSKNTPPAISMPPIIAMFLGI